MKTIASTIKRQQQPTDDGTRNQCTKTWSGAIWKRPKTENHTQLHFKISLFYYLLFSFSSHSAGTKETFVNLYTACHTSIKFNTKCKRYTLNNEQLTIWMENNFIFGLPYVIQVVDAHIHTESAALGDINRNHPTQFSDLYTQRKVFIVQSVLFCVVQFEMILYIFSNSTIDAVFLSSCSRCSNDLISLLFVTAPSTQYI